MNEPLHESPLVNSVRSARVIVTCGTGGVGKTSIAAALGVLAAEHGRRAVVITLDPARRLTDAIGVSTTLGNEPRKIDLDNRTRDGEMWVTMLDVRETFDGLVRDTATSPRQAEEVMNNSFYRSLSNSLSGTRDYMAAERLYELSHDPRFDLVIVDTPPSQNALDFLESPERLARFLKHPLVRLLIAPGRGGLRLAGAAMQPVLRVISGVVGNDAFSGAVAFLRAFEGMEQEFSRRALEVAGLLRGSDTHFAVVTAPSPDALTQAQHFVNELARMRISLHVAIANRMPPRFGASTSEEERTLANSATGDEAIARQVVAELLADAEAAQHRVSGFLAQSREVHPRMASINVFERSDDIHDMASIHDLANELAAPVAAQ